MERSSAARRKKVACSDGMSTDTMPRIKRGDDKKRGDPMDPIERTDERSSPGSGEEEDGEGAADLQPDDVERDDTAR
jgi:hypothetical protein